MRLKVELVLIVSVALSLITGISFRLFGLKSDLGKFTPEIFLSKSGNLYKTVGRVASDETSSTPTPTVYCKVPSSGCPSNYYWDYSSCSCRLYTSTSSSTSCPPPSEGCGSNYYWDTSSCSCKYYQATPYSCSPPTVGCGEGKYWDYYSCDCKSSSSGTGSGGSGSSTLVTPCPSPTAGCSSNSYWDSYSCSCKASFYYSQENFDRFAHEPESRIDCVKGLLTEDEYQKLRYYVSTNSGEQEEIGRLGDKVKSCWSYTSSGSAYITPKIYENPLLAEDCLFKSLGESAYRDILSGVRSPTYEEHLKYKICYKGEGKTSVVNYYESAVGLSKDTETCLKTILTSSLYSKIKSGVGEVPYGLREKVNRCFGINPQAFEEGRIYKIPDSVKSCLLESIGEERFNEISFGKSEPDSNEKGLGDKCFSDLNKDQLKFLPPPPEQILFLEAKPDFIKFEGVMQETKSVKGKDFGGRVVFSGQALPNSTVTLYIFSEPIVVTTKVDENGDWVYELNQPLEGEKHVAYAIARDESGSYVRSAVLDFTVVAAEKDIARQLLQEETISDTANRQFLRLAFIILVPAVVSVFLLYGIYINRKMAKQPGMPPPDVPPAT